MADTTAGVQVFVGPANQLELGDVTEGPALVTLETISESKQRISFRIPSPTQVLVDAALNAETAAEEAALDADAAKVSAEQAAATAATAARAPTVDAVRVVVNEEVPPAVTIALANDDIPKNAAAAAVGQKLNEAGVVSGQKEILGNDDVRFALTDAAGRRSWLEIGADGKPTTYAKKVVADTVGPDIITAASDGTKIPAPTVETTGTVYAITDASGRRSWIEIGADGKPTAHAKKSIVDSVGADIIAAASDGTRMPASIPESSGAVFAIVDKDGRRSDIEIGADGKLTKRVLDSIANRITFPFVHPTEPVELLQQDYYSLVVGKTYRLIYKYWTRYLGADHKVIVEGPAALTGDFGAYWEYTPAVPESFTLSVKIMDRAYNLIRDYSIPVTVYPAGSGANLRHLAIGDSITDMYEYVVAAIQPFAGAKTVGTGVKGNGAAYTEGKSGWSLAAYHTHFGRPDGSDSPFLFPTTVAGAKYWGNAAFWKRVCYTDPNALNVKGYQKIARGWSDTAPFLFNANGYPIAPAEGDVVYDPSLAAGNQWVQYTGGAWAPTATPAREFSFVKYMQRYAAAFPDGGPTSISIMLGTNDFGAGADVAASWAGWAGQMNTTIAAIRAWSGTVPIIIIAPPNSGGYATYAAYQGSKVMRDKNAQDAVKRMFDTFDTDEHRANRVYVTSAMGAVSEANITDTVHPNSAGHAQLGAWPAGKIAQLISEGKIS